MLITRVVDFVFILLQLPRFLLHLHLPRPPLAEEMPGDLSQVVGFTLPDRPVRSLKNACVLLVLIYSTRLHGTSATSSCMPLVSGLKTTSSDLSMVRPLYTHHSSHSHNALHLLELGETAASQPFTLLRISMLNLL